jgi:ribonuclease D
MNAALMAVLTDNERLLVAETEPTELAELDEDGAVALEARVRRARAKYTGQYRRTAAGRVAEKGGRGMARPQNQRAAMKAEAFEEALARVSRRVSVLSRQAARELRAKRLAAARGGRASAPPGGAAAGPGASVPVPRQGQVDDRSFRTPATEKRRASALARGARRQAKRDARLARRQPAAGVPPLRHRS